MNNLIKNALAETNIPSFYLKRIDNTMPCIVYSYNELQGASGDNKEELAKYDIYINLYIKSGISEATEKVKAALSRAGFIKQTINSPIILDGLDYYQITMNYIKLKGSV